MTASTVYENDKVIAFLDIHPINEGHVLIVPKRHCPNFLSLDEKELESMLRVGQIVLSAIQAANIKCEGANFILSDGEVAGQEVMHSHLHLVPRFTEDGQKFGFVSAPSSDFPRERLDQIAKKIASQIENYD